VTAPSTRDQVVDVTEYVCGALEIVDGRVADWDISIVDTVADNASAGPYFAGRARVALSEIDPICVVISMRKDEAEVSSGTGANCLGDPVLAVAWLATTVRDLGSPLHAGEIMLSGALGPMVAVDPDRSGTR